MQNTGGTLKATSHLVCVIYDAASGRIRHIHHDVSLQNSPPASEAEVEAAAFAQLHKRGVAQGGLLALHVSPEELQPRARYDVDPQRRVLRQLAR